MMSALDKKQASILTVLFDRLAIGDTVETLDFKLEGNSGERFHAAYAPLSTDPRVKVVFNLPRCTRHVLLALTRRREREVARLLANIEDYERAHAQELVPGEVVVTPSSTSSDVAPYAIILLRTAAGLDLVNVPDKLEIDGEEICFSLAVPLSKQEQVYRQEAGHDALMDQFRGGGKELFFCPDTALGSVSGPWW